MTPPASSGPSAPLILRVTGATLAAFVAFGLACVLVAIAVDLVGLSGTAGGPAIAILTVMAIAGIVAAFATARLYLARARSWPTWLHALWVVGLVYLCWLFAPQRFTYAEF